MASHSTLSLSTPIRTAVIGYGLGGRVFHAPFVHALPEFSLDAVVTANPERAALAEERYGTGTAVATPDEVFDRADELDLAVITTPNDTHAPLAHRALDAGLHVVVDKPFALSATAAHEIIEHAERVDRRVTVFHNRRWDGDFLTLRGLIERGELGEIRQFDSAFEWWKPELRQKWKDVQSVGEGAGILFDLGPHLIDQAVQLFGPVASGGVHAELDARREGSVSDDDSFVSLHHESGVRSRLWMSAVAPASRPRFRVVGSAGVFESRGLDPQEPQLDAGLPIDDPEFGVRRGDDGSPATALLTSPGGDVRRVPLRAGDYPAYYRGLAGALRGEGALPVEPESAVRTLEIIEDAQRSGGQL